MNYLQKIKAFIKQETILTAGIMLAIISSFIIPPDKEYLSYIDFRTILLLFCLMTVMTGFKQLGVFKLIGSRLLAHTKDTHQLSIILIFLPFVFSMFITNDVALITFVPFTIIVLKLADKENLLIPIVVLQTVAANLGSMLMPMGNPQNLYLYACSSMTLAKFIKLMLPYTIVSAICLFTAVLTIKKEPVAELDMKEASIKKSSVVFYTIEFILCLLTVANIIDIRVLALIIVLFTLIYSRSSLKDIDYSLLFTFIAFFVFIGNMGRIPEFKSFIENILNTNEVIVSILSSQIISNVPTALLLSGFTDKWELLIIGVNIGGLGTLIASMASLISYKQIVKESPALKGKYFKLFTITNIIMLIILLITFFILK